MTSDISITFATIVAAFGALIVLANGISVVGTFIKPIKKAQSILSKHEELLCQIQKKLTDIEQDKKLSLKCLAALLECEAPDNCVETIKEAREALNQFLFER